MNLIEAAEREAYARGYRDAMAASAAALAALKPPLESSPPISGNEPSETPRRRGRPAKSIALVQEMIGARPGLTGAEIVRALAEQKTPILERTMRSCLRRLKVAGEIWQRNKKWYPKSRPKVEAANAHGEVSGTPPH
jgi:hypothetical protein